MENEYRLALIFDFRSPVERKASPDPAIPGCRLLETDVLSPEATGVTDDGNGLEELYRRMLEDPHFANSYYLPFYKELVGSELGKTGYASFLRELIRLPKNRSALWHCAAGKDRTGMGTILLLLALGTPLELICEDYLSHNINQKNEIEKQVALFYSGSDPMQKNNVRDFFSVFPEFLDSALEAMAKIAGRPEDFPEKGLGLTKKEIAARRKTFWV